MGNGGGNGGGNNNVNLEQTELKVYLSVNPQGDKNGFHKFSIMVETEPHATVYYHTYGKSGSHSITTIDAGDTGEVVIDNDYGYDLHTSMGDRIVYNIWAKAPGKLQSHHMHITPSSGIPI